MEAAAMEGDEEKGEQPASLQDGSTPSNPRGRSAGSLSFAAGHKASKSFDGLSVSHRRGRLPVSGDREAEQKCLT